MSKHHGEFLVSWQIRNLCKGPYIMEMIGVPDAIRTHDLQLRRPFRAFSVWSVNPIESRQTHANTAFARCFQYPVKSSEKQRNSFFHGENLVSFMRGLNWENLIGRSR